MLLKNYMHNRLFFVESFIDDKLCFTVIPGSLLRFLYEDTIIEREAQSLFYYVCRLESFKYVKICLSGSLMSVYSANILTTAEFTMWCLYRGLIDLLKDEYFEDCVDYIQKNMLPVYSEYIDEGVYYE